MVTSPIVALRNPIPCTVSFSHSLCCTYKPKDKHQRRASATSARPCTFCVMKAQALEGSTGGHSLGREMDLVNLALALALAAMAVCVAVPGVAAQGDIRVFNVIGDVVTMSNCRDFVGRSLPAGSITIEPMKEIEWRFHGYPTSNRDWTCRFQWTDRADCGIVTGGPCRMHGKDVRLWSSACVDCVWRTHHEGFYRRDGRVQPADWHFMFGWD